MTQTKTRDFRSFTDFRKLPELSENTPPPSDSGNKVKTNGHKKAEEKENAVVIDLKDKWWGTAYVSPDKFPPDEFGNPEMGRLWKYGNDLVYLLVHRKNNEWAVIEPPDKHASTTPDALFSALNPPGVKDVLGNDESTLEKLKTLGIYILIGAALFLIYMISQDTPKTTKYDNAMILFGIPYLKTLLTRKVKL